MTDSAGTARRLNVTHVVAAGVLVAALPAQWLVSRVVVASIQVVPQTAGWQMAPVVVFIVVLLSLIVFATLRPEPVPGLVRVIGVQALVLAGVFVVVMELVMSALGFIWDAGSGGLRPGAGIWMVAIAGLLLVVVGDRDPLSHLLPGEADSASTIMRLAVAGVWLFGLASTIWWTAWRNEPFAEFGPVLVVASTVPVVGVLSFLGVISCWIALAVALVGRRRLAVAMVAIGGVMLTVSVVASSLVAWAVDFLPVERLLSSARARAVGWAESVEIPDAVPDDLADRLVPSVEGSAVDILVQPMVLWVALLVTVTSLGLIAATSRRHGGGTRSGADPEDPGYSAGPFPAPHGTRPAPRL